MALLKFREKIYFYILWFQLLEFAFAHGNLFYFLFPLRSLHFFLILFLCHDCSVTATEVS